MSKTIGSLLIIFLGYIGIVDIFTEAEVASTIDNTIQIIGMIGVWYGRFMASGQIDIVGIKVNDELI